MQSDEESEQENRKMNMEYLEEIDALRSAYRQGAKAFVIRDCRRFVAHALSRVADPAILETNNDVAASLQFELRSQSKIRKTEQLAANCLAMCIAWQESQSNDHLASNIFVLMERLKSLSPSKRQENKQAAKRLHPNAKKPLRQAIIEMFGREKQGYETFKTFMQVWERETIGGIRATYLEFEKKYLIDDENCTLKKDESALGKDQYTWETLRKMYSELK